MLHDLRRSVLRRVASLSQCESESSSLIPVFQYYPKLLSASPSNVIISLHRAVFCFSDVLDGHLSEPIFYARDVRIHIETFKISRAHWIIA